ncbi:small T antigen [Butcherbird polyomavirus]|uniref:Small T antigen n=1 Tax=Butcherbird polyomavirus TaxID=1394033 RepID=V5K701_9POLY|nr:small T antigen [Butcherbird polyomavirus]AGU68323.1 small T antigen [Butcherbird polyomavirus]
MSCKEIRELRELLGLPPHASYDDIKAAYRKQALMYHPDKGGDEEKMKRLNCLMDKAKEYDFSAEAANSPLFCDESSLSSSDEEDVPAQGSSRPGDDSGLGASFSAGFTDSVSALQFQHACTKIADLQYALLEFFSFMEKQRKQCLAPQYLDLQEAYKAVPWPYFYKHSHF